MRFRQGYVSGQFKQAAARTIVLRIKPGMDAYVLADQAYDYSIYGDTIAWAGRNAICPGCKKEFFLYVHFGDREELVIDDKLRLATEALRRHCPDHIPSLTIR